MIKWFGIEKTNRLTFCLQTFAIFVIFRILETPCVKSRKKPRR